LDFTIGIRHCRESIFGKLFVSSQVKWYKCRGSTASRGCGRGRGWRTTVEESACTDRSGIIPYLDPVIHLLVRRGKEGGQGRGREWYLCCARR
jgi:hypothetical protein